VMGRPLESFLVRIAESRFRKIADHIDSATGTSRHLTVTSSSDQSMPQSKKFTL
jgi:hypothetical protein